MGDIYRANRVNGQYPKVENLGVPVNSEYHEVDAFVAPDESYMIFCSDRPGGYGKADFYVSFRKKDGSWTVPVNLGDKINSPFSEYIPSVSPDGKYFFFTTDKTGQRDIYWVDAKIIRSLKPDDLK
jgi:Tol biopolymer transport system component